jgi:hypothetical protein
MSENTEKDRTATLESKSPAEPRVLLFSQRNIFKNVLFRCPHHEFEDVICQIDSADLLAPHVEKRFNVRHKIAKQIAWHSPIALNPGISKTKVNKKYDLLFAICGSPVDLLMVNTIENWENVAKVSICLIDELWVKELPSYKHFLNIMAKFTFVMLYYSQSIEKVGESVGSKCFFLPPGIDSIRFCPYPGLPNRGIDIYSIGRRSEVTHQKLIKMSADNGIFYVHDSISGDHAINSTEHRMLFAEMAKRSRYFIVNPGLIDRPDVRGNQSEIGNRYFEGAASGAIMIGEYPKNKEFEKLFDWPDAVLHLPYGSADIDRIVEDVDKQPEWQERMRRNNVVHALTRHDWVYRWEAVLKTAGLEPLQGLVARKERLRCLAEVISDCRPPQVSA